MLIVNQVGQQTAGKFVAIELWVVARAGYAAHIRYLGHIVGMQQVDTQPIPGSNAR